MPKRAWCVTPESVAILPAWLKDKLIPRLGTAAGFWMRPDRAEWVMEFLRSIHVRYRLLKTTYQRCLVCGRPTVGDEAEKLRKQMESAPNGRELPCRAECFNDRDSKLWDILREAV